MAEITNKERTHEKITYRASFKDDDGKEYEISILETFEENIGYMEKKLLIVEIDGKDIDEKGNEALFGRIRDLL